MISLVSWGARIPSGSGLARDLAKAFRLLDIPQSALCEIYFCNPRRMRELNKRFRHKDHATTVLSFEIPGGFPAGQERAIGEVYVCPDEIGRRPAPGIVHTGSVGFSEKLMYYILHGILHVRGYDHDRDWFSRKRMEQTELSLWYRICPRV